MASSKQSSFPLTEEDIEHLARFFELLVQYDLEDRQEKAED